MKRHIALLATCIFLLSAVYGLSNVRPSEVFSNNMVLQRERPVPVWGQAEKGTTVTVEFSGQTKTAVADADGKWQVKLDAMSTNVKPQVLKVRGPANEIRLSNVVVGDVWFCSGQSNMGRSVSRSVTPDDMPRHYPLIRCLNAPNRGTPYPVETFQAPAAWWVCTVDRIPDTCAIGFFFARRVFEETGIPVGIVWSAWAGSTINEWMGQPAWRLTPELAEQADAVDAWYPHTEVGRRIWQEKIEIYEQWQKKADAALANGKPFPYPQPLMPEPPRERGSTCFYNSRVHPYVPMAMKGFLWYQGESDYRTKDYAIKQQAMVKHWRQLFADGDEIPFYWMQIQRSGDYCSPLIRDQQFKALSLIPHSGMAVLLDLDVNVHPANKYDSGERLALWALAKDYGKNDVVFSGPLYKGHTVKGKTIVVEFEHSETGLMIGKKDMLNPAEEVPGGKLANIKIAGQDEKWHAAQSKIEGGALVVWSDEEPEPVAVRYCYENIPPEPFLYNKAGLPAAQFKTDNWSR